MSVHLTIDELVLVGVERGDRDAVATAIERAIVGQLDVALLRARVGGHRHRREAGASVTVNGAAGSARREADRNTSPYAAGSSALGTRVGSVVARVIDGRQR